MAETQSTEAVQTQPAPAKTNGPKDGPIWGTGRRKKSVARVRIYRGSGKFLINGRQIDAYFPFTAHQNEVVAPLVTVDARNDWDVYVNVQGGGMTGQSGAISLGLARALSDAIPETEHTLRDQGLLTRDARAKERKKYGQRGARRRFQFSKR
ncbi:MAG: 30S ribosomal protein S9 [Phycisphaerae bacterium]